MLKPSCEYQERLETGNPSNPDYRLQDYLELLVYENMGTPDKALAARARINAYSAFDPGACVDAIREKADQPRRTTFRAQPQWQALQAVNSIVRGSRRRRSD